MGRSLSLDLAQPQVNGAERLTQNRHLGSNLLVLFPENRNLARERAEFLLSLPQQVESLPQLGGLGGKDCLVVLGSCSAAALEFLDACMQPTNERRRSFRCSRASRSFGFARRNAAGQRLCHAAPQRLQRCFDGSQAGFQVLIANRVHGEHGQTLGSATSAGSTPRCGSAPDLNGHRSTHNAMARTRKSTASRRRNSPPGTLNCLLSSYWLWFERSGGTR